MNNLIKYENILEDLKDKFTELEKKEQNLNKQISLCNIAEEELRDDLKEEERHIINNNYHKNLRRFILVNILFYVILPLVISYILKIYIQVPLNSIGILGIVEIISLAFFSSNTVDMLEDLQLSKKALDYESYFETVENLERAIALKEEKLQELSSIRDMKQNIGIIIAWLEKRLEELSNPEIISNKQKYFLDYISKCNKSDKGVVLARTNSTLRQRKNRNKYNYTSYKDEY